MRVLCGPLAVRRTWFYDHDHQTEVRMAEDTAVPTGPDLAQGVPAQRLSEAPMLVGHVGTAPVLLARVGEEYLAIDAECSHYHGPLGEGLLVGDTVRCPWHHACFSLRTGQALRAPALQDVGCWATEVRGDQVVVLHRKPAGAPARSAAIDSAVQRVVIVGGGAAGFAAARRLRELGHAGSLVMLSDDHAAPVDRPNLSKDYLAGTAPEDWLPLADDAFFAEHRIDLRLGVRASRLDTAARQVELSTGERLPYDRLLLATGAQPVRLPLPGIDLPHVHTLRTLADCRAIVARAATARRAVVMGASFIGLEVAASLRTRGIEVHVIAPEQRPMERVLGPQMGDFVRRLHEAHGVHFHLGDTATAIDTGHVTLKSGAQLQADLVVVGVGVKPRLELAEQAGLRLDRGVLVDAQLQTSVPGVYAAGDIARWPDPHTGEAIRVEHWVVAQRQGQTAAANMLGLGERFDAVPFFWSQHYDVPINYVGHAEAWDEIEVEGDIDARDCVLRYKRAGRVLAVASIYRDADNLRAEAAMEQRCSTA
jgi:NADPH-dependent 2,4-dienoyl-CoA reductase/sulfur reductase-like enzyme/nitrite reductase/ring-hydroxylating ferredoxin subunit